MPSVYRELVVDDNFPQTNIGMLMTAQCHQSQGILLISRAVHPRELRGVLDLTTTRFSMRLAEITRLALPRAGLTPGKLHQRAIGGQTRRDEGCVQGSMALRDSMFNVMAYENWRLAVECKALGSWNLEMILPKDLDFFVMLSSASNVIGLSGQSNYAAGHLYMDSLARYRVAHGQRAVSLDLGPMVHDGILVETAGFLDKVLAYGSLAPVTRAQLYGILNHYCNPSKQFLDPDTAQLVFGISGSGGDRNTLVETPLFSRLKLENISGNPVLQREGHGRIDFKKLFQEATSLQEAREIVRRAVIDKMVHSYHLIPEDKEVDVYAPLHTFRIDSLLAVELCNWIGKAFAADIAVMEVMGGASLVMVDLAVATRSQLTHPQWG